MKFPREVIYFLNEEIECSLLKHVHLELVYVQRTYMALSPRRGQRDPRKAHLHREKRSRCSRPVICTSVLIRDRTMCPEDESTGRGEEKRRAGSPQETKTGGQQGPPANCRRSHQVFRISTFRSSPREIIEGVTRRLV